MIVFSMILFVGLMIPIIYLFIVVPYRSYTLLKYEIEGVDDNPPPYSKGDYMSAAQNPV
jgi:hypothetical protein